MQQEEEEEEKTFFFFSPFSVHLRYQSIGIRNANRKRHSEKAVNAKYLGKLRTAGRLKRKAQPVNIRRKSVAAESEYTGVYMYEV